MRIFWLIVIGLWAWIACQLMNNFEEDLEQLSFWRKGLLCSILLICAPIFFIEEILEILIDDIIEED